ncbi:MAG: response regulator [Mucilaginibacter sp.]
MSFILVENTELDQYIAQKLIKRVVGDVNIETFFTAEAALDHITFDKAPDGARNIILLDLMMPRMNGANFISLFDALPEKIRENYQIVIVTSSMNKAELERLRKRENVEMIIEKPLTREKLKSLITVINATANGKNV